MITHFLGIRLVSVFVAMMLFFVATTPIHAQSITGVPSPFVESMADMLESLRKMIIQWLPDGTPHIEPGEFRAIYLTSTTALSERGKELVQKWKEKGGNAIVFDVQHSGGDLVWNSEKLREYVRFLHEQDIFAVGRFVVLKVPSVAAAHPDWTLRDERGRPWANREGAVWLDPSHPEVKNYLFEATESIARAGVDEIQFDYIRFPERSGTPVVTFEKDVSREQLITNFVCEAAEIVHGEGKKLGLDVFGVIVWNHGYDGEIVGQKTQSLAWCADAIYPMVYPSHFGDGFGGFAKPAQNPEYFVSESTKLFLEQSLPHAAVRPWLQGFSYRVPNFGSNYVKRQIDGLKDLADDGYAIWNASNSYDATFALEH